MKIAFIINYDKHEESLPPFIDLLSFLENRNHQVKTFSNKDDITDNNYDLFVIFGGDGTMLGQARKLAEKDAPMIGINCGHLGFTTEFNKQTFKKYWNNIEDRDYVLNERILLDVKVFQEYKRGYKFHSLAANDAVVTAGPPYRLISLNIATVSDKKKYDSITDIRSDGLIVSTPLGSTAYNLSVGGPIVHPDSKAICLAPIAAHSLSCRPIIVPNDFEIKITLDQVNEGTTLMIDGQKQFNPLYKNEFVVIAKSKYTLRTIANPYQSYWKTLKDKMHWAK